MNAKELAKLFHDVYERLAPSYGYKTKEETKIFDENSPNGKLMIATCEEILSRIQAVNVYAIEGELIRKDVTHKPLRHDTNTYIVKS